MFLTYVWQATGMSREKAYERFSHILSRQRDLYAHAWGLEPELDIHHQDNLLVGQLRYETGVNGWKPWIEQGSHGIVWGGICEDYLGCQYTPVEFRNLIRVIEDKPEEIAQWDGRFCVVTWNRRSKKVSLTTAATESPTLWYSEGPHGWCVGSRASVLLELVGRTKAPSLENVNLFLTYGYLIGNGSLFEGVERVKSRTQIVFNGASRPLIRTYTSLLEYLNLNHGPTKRQDQIQFCAERITHRVSKQLKYSRDPQILLTGGRDSRNIAAAAKRSGYTGSVHTTGSANSKDCRIARKVADRLQLQWHRNPRFVGDSEMAALATSIDNVQLWVQLSEGIETCRHALPFQDFFKRNLPIPEVKRPLFHGLAGGIGKAVYYSNYKGAIEALNQKNVGKAHQLIVNKRNYSFGKFNCPAAGPGEIQQWQKSAWADFYKEVQEFASVAQLLDLFQWQNRCLHWGEDMLSVKSPMFWQWTSLQDKELIRIYYQIPTEEKISKRFVEDITIAVYPDLKGLPYDHNQGTFSNSFVRTFRAARRLLPKLIEKTLPLPIVKSKMSDFRDPYLVKFWETVLLGKGQHIWPECIDRAMLQNAIRSNPRAEILWNTATIDLFYKAHFH